MACLNPNNKPISIPIFDGQGWPSCTPCSISLGKRPAWLRHFSGIQPGLWPPPHQRSFNLGSNSVDIYIYIYIYIDMLYIYICWLEVVEVQQTKEPTNQPINQPTHQPTSHPSPPERRCCSESQERRASWRVISGIFRSASREHCIWSHSSIPNDWWSEKG